MFCANCGNEMKEDDIFCNQCGFRKPKEEQTQPAEQPVVQNAEQSAPQLEEQPVTQPVQTEAPVAGQKKGKWIFAAALAAAVVVVLAVILILVFRSESMQNWTKKTFSQPEEYYQWVEGRAVENRTACAADIYQDVIRDSIKIYDTSVNVEAKLELAEAGKDMVSLLGMAGVDMSWLEEAAVSGGITIKDNKIAVNAEEAGTISVVAMMDLAEEKGYIQFPDISSTYMGSDVDGAEELIEVFEALKIVYENTPDKKQVEKLLNKYVELALTCIDDVEMSDGHIRAEGVSQDCVELEVTIDEKVMADVAETVLSAMAEDEELEKLIVKSISTMEEADLDLLADLDFDMDAEEIYEELQEALEDAAGQTRYIKENDMEIVMVVYVDSKGNICGRSLEYEGVTVEMVMAHAGNDFGYKLECKAEGESVALTGSGKDKGGKLTGEFAVEYNGMAFVEIQVDGLDTDKLANGQLNGVLTISPSSALVRAADISEYSSVVGEMAVVIKAESGTDNLHLECKVQQDDEEWGSFTVSLSRGDGKIVAIPAGKEVIEVEDVDDFEDWFETVEWDNLIEKLEDAGIPFQVIDLLEEVADMDAEEFLQMLVYNIF